MIGLDWALYKNFVEEVDITAQVVNTTLSSDDIAYFSPKMKDWHLTLTDVNADVSGPVADMSGSLRSVRTGADTKLRSILRRRDCPMSERGILSRHFRTDDFGGGCRSAGGCPHRQEFARRGAAYCKKCGQNRSYRQIRRNAHGLCCGCCAGDRDRRCDLPVAGELAARRLSRCAGRCENVQSATGRVAGKTICSVPSL